MRDIIPNRWNICAKTQSRCFTVAKYRGNILHGVMRCESVLLLIRWIAIRRKCMENEWQRSFLNLDYESSGGGSLLQGWCWLRCQSIFEAWVGFDFVSFFESKDIQDSLLQEADKILEPEPRRASTNIHWWIIVGNQRDHGFSRSSVPDKKQSLNLRYTALIIFSEWYLTGTAQMLNLRKVPCCQP